MLNAGYFYHYSYPFTTYADNVFLSIEMMVVFVLMYKYSAISTVQFGMDAILFVGLVVLFTQNLLPEKLYLANQSIIAVLGKIFS